MLYRWVKDVWDSWSYRMQLCMALAVGLAFGMALVVARISNMVSYFSDAPETCMNCHVMTDAYATWKRGSHAEAAVCNDCHVPQSNPIAKWAFKGKDGAKHSAVFTLRLEPQVLKLSHGAVPVIQANCLRCHSNQFAMVRLAEVSERQCWDCHSNIHGKVHSLSASPEVLRPKQPSAGLRRKK